MKTTMMNYSRAIVVLIIVFLTGSSVRSQIPDYFGSNPEWRMRYQVASSTSPCITIEDIVVYVNGDTVINSVTYKNLCYKSYTTYYNLMPNGCTLSPYYSEGHQSAVRQQGRQIYQLQPSSLNDTLLYDFGLGIGDTLPSNNINSNNNLVVTGIDSILIAGEYRRKLTFSGSLPISSIIEGVGQEIGNNSGGLVYPFPPYFESNYEFACFSYNDTTWLGETNSLCYFNVGLEDEIKELSLFIYPNPSQDIAYIQGNGFDYVNAVTASDIMGRTIRVPFSITDENTLVLETSNLPAGSFVIRLESLNHRYKPVKFFKQ